MALSENGAVPSKWPFWHGNFRRENDPSRGFRCTLFSDKPIQPTWALGDDIRATKHAGI